MSREHNLTSSVFAERFAEWQRLYAALESVLSPQPDDQAEMLAQMGKRVEVNPVPACKGIVLLFQRLNTLNTVYQILHHSRAVTQKLTHRPCIDSGKSPDFEASIRRLRAMNGATSPLPDAIELVALDPARNVRRRYAISASLDLFGMIVVETRWGRIGTRGQAQRHAFVDRAAAERHIAVTLRRRGTAETRIGVAYRPMAVAGD